MSRIVLSWTVSHVEAQVSVQLSGLTKPQSTRIAYVRFLSAVDYAVLDKITRPCESFATNSALERFPSRMTSPVFTKVAATLPAPAAVRAPVLTSVNIHVFTKTVRRWKTFIAFTARVPVSGSVCQPVNIQGAFECKLLVAHAAFVRFLSAVNSAVLDKWTRTCHSFAANSTLKRSLSSVTPPVSCQLIAIRTTFSTLRAPVFTYVNIHVHLQSALVWKAPATFVACIPLFSSEVSVYVNFQRLFRCKPFVAYSTQIRLWHVVTRIYSTIITISFSRCVKGTFTWIIRTTTDIIILKCFTTEIATRQC